LSGPISVFRYLSADGTTLGCCQEGRLFDLGEPLGTAWLADWLRLPDPVAAAAEAAGPGRAVGASLESLEGEGRLLAPLDHQEVWAAGVTYLRSKVARMEESEGGGSFYDRVYDAERPEIFFKATPSRVVGPGGEVRTRVDSKWNVPEPELALLISPGGRLIGYTLGNDMSSRDIEGENPLYLPQAKVYRQSCALGPVIVLETAVRDHREFDLQLTIRRGDRTVFKGETSTGRMKRSFRDLVSYVMHDNLFPDGVFLLTGTGIVPPDDFTLEPGDWIRIHSPEIGTLANRVVRG
jgi:2-dehydro-3-deoxy-D-arabinonate dehydratase